MTRRPTILGHPEDSGGRQCLQERRRDAAMGRCEKGRAGFSVQLQFSPHSSLIIEIHFPIIHFYTRQKDFFLLLNLHSLSSRSMSTLLCPAWCWQTRAFVDCIIISSIKGVTCSFLPLASIRVWWMSGTADHSPCPGERSEVYWTVFGGVL